MSNPIEKKMNDLLELIKEKQTSLIIRSENLYNDDSDFEPEHLEAIEDSIDRELEMLRSIQRKIIISRKELLSFF